MPPPGSDSTYPTIQFSGTTSYKGALGRFTSLRSPRDILRFVKTYGKLNLCEEHQMPWTHNPPPDTLVSRQALPHAGYFGCMSMASEGVEPVRVWLEYVGQFRAALQLAGGVARKDRGVLARFDEWKLICDPALIPDDPDEARTLILPADLDEARTLIRSHINDQLDIGRVRPRLEWSADQPEASFGFESGSMGLYGVLALQLAMAVARAGGLYTCTGCGNFYARTAKRPKPGEANYCPECGRKGANRDAKRRWLERQRKAKEADDGEAGT